ncbi:hypothetical protein NPIL_127201 [Nephila pilipes]|uniref:Uncharacterized protein n=1 Tax=Nephila pilipes TaxID=299642 RepID=A0A8X6MTG7_NEPPI|nr:hypothetical protein NPIL_127201 [Nephila pilipes]
MKASPAQKIFRTGNAIQTTLEILNIPLNGPEKKEALKGIARTANRLVASYNPGRARRTKRTCPKADSLPCRTYFRSLPERCKRETCGEVTVYLRPAHRDEDKR